MKENQKSEKTSNSSSNNKKQSSETSPSNPKKTSSSSQKPSVTNDDKSKDAEKEFTETGHDHDYSTPVAGEDGEAEDQSKSQNKKSIPSTSKNPSSTMGKNPGEKSKF